MSHYSTEPQVLHQQLAGLAQDVATDLHGKLAELNTIAQAVDDSLKKADPDQLIHPDPLRAVQAWLQPYPCPAYRHRGSVSGDYFTWLSPQGRALFGLDPTTAPPAFAYAPPVAPLWAALFA